MNGSSSVSGNSASFGGGIGNGGTLTLNDSSSVSGNTASGGGGGIFNYSATLTLNGSSSVSGNIADSDNDGFGTGGGISNCFGTLTGATNDVNVNNNYLVSSSGTENNIASCI